MESGFLCLGRVGDPAEKESDLPEPAEPEPAKKKKAVTIVK